MTQNKLSDDETVAMSTHVEINREGGCTVVLKFGVFRDVETARIIAEAVSNVILEDMAANGAFPVNPWVEQ